MKVDRLQVVNCDADAALKKKISKDTILSDAFLYYNDDHLENLHLIRRHKFPDVLRLLKPHFHFQHLEISLMKWWCAEEERLWIHTHAPHCGNLAFRDEAGYLVSLNNISFEFHDIYKWQDCIFQFQQYITCHKCDASNIIGLFIQVLSSLIKDKQHPFLVSLFTLKNFAWWENTVKIHNFFAAQLGNKSLIKLIYDSPLFFRHFFESVFLIS